MECLSAAQSNKTLLFVLKLLEKSTCTDKVKECGRTDLLKKLFYIIYIVESSSNVCIIITLNKEMLHSEKKEQLKHSGIGSLFKRNE